VSSAWATCQDDEGDDTVYQLVLLAEDGSLHSLTPMGNVLWSREEALAAIAHVEMLPMPAEEEDDTDSPAYLSGSTDVAEQFIRFVKKHR
jgi:propanediol dehydratase large subunit